MFKKAQRRNMFKKAQRRVRQYLIFLKEKKKWILHSPPYLYEGPKNIALIEIQPN